MTRPRVVLERNVVVKNWKRADLRLCLCSPSPYEVGFLNLALQILYSLWNEREDVLCERAFVNVLGGALSLESRRSLREFDVLAFSIHYEAELVGLVNMLRAAGIPPLARDRRPGEHPVLIAGGPVVTENPRPLERVFDCLFIGEVEDVSDELLDALKEASEAHSLDPLADLPHVYVPGLSCGRVRRAFVRDLNKSYYPTAQFRPERLRVAFGPAFLLEVSRGCSYKCRFCLARQIYRPMRVRRLPRLLEILKEGLERTATDRVSVISFAASDHPELTEILESLLARGVSFTIPSLRVDRAPTRALELLRESGQVSVTVAPEVASERLADALGKGVYPEEVIELGRELRRLGFSRLKLYFMVGVPGEREDEAAAIGKLAREVRELGFSRVTVAINPLIPKPHTPLQWAPYVRERDYRRRVELVRREAGRGIKLSGLEWREGLLEVAVARGGPEVGEALASASAEGRVSRRRALLVVKKLLKREARPALGYSLGAELPWEVVDVGVRRSEVVKEYERFLEALSR